MVTVKKALEEVVVAVVMKKGGATIMVSHPQVKVVFVDYEEATGEEKIDGVQCMSVEAEVEVNGVGARKALIAARAETVEEAAEEEEGVGEAPLLAVA